jgi:hypothetical protein
MDLKLYIPCMIKILFTIYQHVAHDSGRAEAYVGLTFQFILSCATCWYIVNKHMDVIWNYNFIPTKCLQNNTIIRRLQNLIYT